MARRLTALLVTTAVMVVIASMATAQGATVFYAACDALSDTDTIKIKKIEEDGTGAATVADTTIRYCGALTPSRYFTGLAIHDGFAYFSWLSYPMPSSSTGIGRISLLGGAPDFDFIPGPSGARFLRLNANPTAGYLYAYADDGFATNARVVRIPVVGGSYQTVVPGVSMELSFGIASGKIFHSIMGGQNLYERNLDGTNSRTVFAGDLGSSPTAVLYVGNSGGGASLVAGSSSKLFALTAPTYGDNFGSTGISTLNPATTPFTANPYGAVPAVSGMADRPGNQVWSGSYLYFTQSDSYGTDAAIGRVKEDGTDLKRDWVTAAMVHQIAIGTMPTPTTTPTPGPSVTPPKPTLKLATIRNQTPVLVSSAAPSTDIDCTTSNSQTLSSCQVEILANASLLKTGRAGTGKTVLVGKGTATSTTGSATLKVKVRITNKQARAILKKGGRLKATIRVTATTTASQTSTASKGTTLVGAKKKAKALYRR